MDSCLVEYGWRDYKSKMKSQITDLIKETVSKIQQYETRTRA